MTMAAPSETTKKRGRGRPAVADVVTRDLIIDTAYEFTKTVSLDELSIVQVARRLGVVAGSLHYHVGTKDDLTSAILNRFYKNLYVELTVSTPNGSWRENIGHLARTLMNFQRRHVGIAQHVMAHARYRIFQKVAPDEIDYGVIYLDFAFDMFRRAGFSSRQTALFYHAIALHCLVSSNSDAAGLGPVAHETFLRAKVQQYRGDRYPGLAHALEEFATIQTDEAFTLGLDALVDNFATARGATAAREPARPKKRRAAGAGT
ncbi:TetR/AcrR family transcriptional regulator [Mesorhizobium sp. M7A.F.Ca.US.006.01.1.1]|uniref:TetR/AcrR family transcriptional regulator n=1 Tax=Mesorhizobium sp. M7A.F.Ca.US.006.01.1.1 TaxID=2496707 RepID=UPI000FCA9BEF|nr:TetR/AcrR family transcriptional regulator [Mesorhizobium sp. M7A.F.Ca.US.006.01.1.1]RUZ71001.1 TetR/AcrR family transcriptional regulator [Mesorhizobium sp. M7A.F.Ca.US.006.01.1.1]